MKTTIASSARPVAFLDPWLRRPAFVVEPHDGAIREREIRDDEADAGEQLADVVLDSATIRLRVTQLSA